MKDSILTKIKTQTQKIKSLWQDKTKSSKKILSLSVGGGGLLVLGVFLLGFTLDGQKKLSQELKEESQNNLSEVIPVETVVVENSKLLQDLSSFGTISYSTKNDVTVQVEGILKKLLVKEGQQVKKQDPLAQIENIQLEIQLQQGETALNSAQAGLDLATTRLEEGRLAVESQLLNIEKLELQLKQQELELEESQLELEKQKKLLELGGITPAAYRSQEVALEGQEAAYSISQKELESQSLGFRNQDLIRSGIEPATDKDVRRQQLVELNTRTLEAELVSARANLDSAEKNLRSIQELMSHLVIRAPSSGVVATKYFEQGEFLPENEKLLTIIDVNQVHAVFSIQEQDIHYFTLGSPVEVEVPALGLKFDSPVQEISAMADPQSGNFTLKSYIENQEEKIRPGMFVKCQIPRESPVYPTIPESALLSPLVIDEVEGDENFAQVFLLHQGRAIKRDVKLVDSSDGKVWIASGLEEGNLVINNPSPFLKEGQSVE